ncbi:carbohydrate ABC transporter permease [Actinopolymorpha alba]|uniref:carbohydrate ABC transporter permease n=1 Tax=Actinopolymorpha alba TaxID=533267 RepID=UPI00035F093F|nr:sugar ABC transporter permease [Actinopolymorpha alba]
MRKTDTRSSTPAWRGTKRNNLVGYAFLAPWFVGLAVLTAGPMVTSLYLSFTDFDLFTAPSWVGVSNYVEMFTSDPRYLQSLTVTFVYVALSVPLQLGFALLLAVVLNRGLRGLGFYRALYYVPSLLGGSVAIAVVWRQVFDQKGLANQVLGWFGIAGKDWISIPDTALHTLVLLSVWQFGSPMIIFLAGLRQIPRELHEAAEVDGAGPVRRFVQITLPLLSPIIFFNLVLQIIQAFQAFTSAFIVSGGTGGPSDSTLFYTLYLYTEGFGNFRMGYASAMAWVLLAIVAAFTAVNFLMSRFWVFYGDERS